MTIEINKDIERYTESFLLGLTLKQSVYSGLSLLSGCLVVFLLYEKIGMTFSCYIAVPVVAPIALCGFYTYNSMSFPEILTKYLQNIFRNRWLLYHADEYQEEMEEYKKEKLLTSKANQEQKKKEKIFSIQSLSKQKTNPKSMKAIKQKRKRG